MQKLTSGNKKRIFCFREIQLLIKLHREGFSTLVLPGIVFAGVVVSVLVNVTLVKLIAGEVSLPWIMFPMIVQMSASFCIIIVLIFGRFGVLFKVSTERQVDMWKSKRDKELRKYLRSCPSQRIFFGVNNYFEAETCLNLERFVSEETASLLLLGQ